MIKNITSLSTRKNLVYKELSIKDDFIEMRTIELYYTTLDILHTAKVEAEVYFE